MEKILTVGGYEIPLKSTAATLISYKANFNRDGMRDMIALTKGMPEKGKLTAGALADSNFELDVFYRFLWVLAKAANKDIPPMEEWLGTFDVPPFDFVVAALSPIMDMLVSAATSKVKPKNPPAAAVKTKSRPK